MPITPEDFGVSFKDFLDQMRAQKKPEDAPFFVRKLREHFACEPTGLPVVSESFAPHDHPNIHLAIEEYVTHEGRSAEKLGVALSGYMGKGLSDLVAGQGGFGGAANEGPVLYANVTLDGDRVLACVRRGLFLVSQGDQRVAFFVHEEDKYGSREDHLVEVMANDLATAERCLHDLREAMRGP